MRNFLLATTELLLWFVFILFPSLHFALVLFPPSPVWSGCRGQRSRACRNYLRWNRFVKLLMHTSLLHMFSRKQTVLTFCPECFWSLLNGIRAFILVKHRKMFDFYSRRKKDICWRSFFVCKILQLFSSFSYFWVWSLAGQFGICMEDHYCQENRWRESKYLPADLKHFH